MLKKTMVASERMTKKIRATVKLFPFRRRLVAVVDVGDIPVITLTFSDGFESLPGFSYKHEDCFQTASTYRGRDSNLYLDAD